MKFLLAALVLLGLAGGANAACPDPNPNLVAPPFVDGCPLPAESLTRMLTHPVGTGQFFTDAGASVVKNLDRTFMGGATVSTGANLPSGTWISNSPLSTVPGVYAYLERIGEQLVYSPNGYAAIFGASRTSDNADPGHCCAMGSAVFTYNNNTTNPQAAWGIYSTMVRLPGTGNIQNEFDVGNLGASVRTTPYNNAIDTTVGLAIGCGGEASSVTTTFPCTTGLEIGSNTSPFNTGIKYWVGSLNGADGSVGTTGEAMAMYFGVNLNWYCTANINGAGIGNTPCARIGSITDGLVTNPLQLLFTDGDVRITGSALAGQGDVAFTLNTGLGAKAAEMNFTDNGSTKYQFVKDPSHNFMIKDLSHGTTVFQVSAINGEVDIGGGAGWGLVLNANTILAPGLTTGTPVASLCLDATNNIIKKTTAGPCM